jgi:hypothetical protein
MLYAPPGGGSGRSRGLSALVRGIKFVSPGIDKM